MNTWKTKNGVEITQLLSGRSNAYLISVENKNILVDTGKKKAYAKLIRNLNSLKRANQEMAFLILTHTHFDHCQSARKLKEDYDCQIIVSENARDSIRNGYTILPNGTNLLTHIISRAGKLIGKKKFGYQPFQADLCIKETFDLQKWNMNIKLIETKGHSSDSISLIIDNEIAIVGDALFGVFRHSVSPPFADDKEAMIRSWKKLLDSGCHTFLPGHGKEVKSALLQITYENYSRKYKIN